MGERTGGGEVGMLWGERLGRGRVWRGEGGYEFDEREIADCFWCDSCGNFDWYGDGVVEDA